MATALYVDYQVSFRDPAAHAGLAAEWDAKTRPEKTAWRNAYVQVLDQQAKAEEQETQVRNTRAQFDTDWGNGVLDIRTQADYNRFVTTVRVLQSRYSRLAALYRELGNAWFGLQDVETGQNGVAESIQNALAESATLLEQSRQAANLADQFNATLADPPVVPDAQGRRRMPARWILPGDRDKMRFREKVLDDVHAEELGIDPMDLNPGDESDSSGINESDEESEEEEWEGFTDSDGNEEEWEEFEDGLGEEQGDLIEQEDVPDERWVPQSSLGVGGYSEGYVWLKVNSKGQILDRLVRKDAHLGESEWLHPLRWEGDVLDPNHKMPLEMVITDSLAKLQNLHHTVRFRADPDPSHIDEDLFAYRMYLAYAPFGDLHGVIERHSLPAATATHIPEPFVWYVAEAMARAGIAMHHGVAIRQGEELAAREGSWDDIIHRDLKPSNVFLEFPLAATYPYYRTPILGDYGLAVKTNENDNYLNPQFYRGVGTKGFYAPEQLDQVDRNDLTTIDNFKLSERTNVYGTGVILWCMVMNETDPKEPVWTVDPNDDDTLAVQDPGGVYSDKLKDLIRLCLRYYPKDRPTFTEMLDFIEEAMAGPVDLSNGMMAGDALPAARTANMPRFDDDMHAKWSIPSEDGT